VGTTAVSQEETNLLHLWVIKPQFPSSAVGSIVTILTELTWLHISQNVQEAVFILLTN
jgi:hypothetical protein